MWKDTKYANELINEIDVYLDSMEKNTTNEHKADYIDLINDNIENIDKIIPKLHSVFNLNSSLISRLEEKKASLTSYLSKFRGGKSKITKINKKDILGELRCIYAISGDRKKYVKYKGELITVKDFKKIKNALRRQ
jgi:hypothetical protein